MSQEILKADAVFEGGGVKGIGLVGALSVAEEKGYKWQNLAGTSAGAIVAGLVAAGYSAVELKGIMAELDYRHFKDESTIHKIPAVGPLAHLVLENGIYEGKFFENMMADLLSKKNVKTFGDLIMHEYRNDDRYRFKLRVIASDVTNGKLLVLPQDAADFGIRPEDLNVAAAVRMSMSIPFFFKPVIIKNKKTNQNNFIIDGGILSNFPVWVFDTEGTLPEWPTFGFKLVDPGSEIPHKIKGPISMLSALFSTMMEAHDARYIKNENFARTIPIPTLNVKTTEFNISREKSEALFQSGRKAAEKFFENWDFDTYVKKYRRNPIVP